MNRVYLNLTLIEDSWTYLQHSKVCHVPSGIRRPGMVVHRRYIQSNGRARSDLEHASLPAQKTKQ